MNSRNAALLASLAAFTAYAQVEPAPSFRPDRVLFIDHPVRLAPGLILSIFGNNLGPPAGCVGNHDLKGIVTEMETPMQEARRFISA